MAFKQIRLIHESIQFFMLVLLLLGLTKSILVSIDFQRIKEYLNITSFEWSSDKSQHWWIVSNLKTAHNVRKMSLFAGFVCLLAVSQWAAHVNDVTLWRWWVLRCFFVMFLAQHFDILASSLSSPRLSLSRPLAPHTMPHYSKSTSEIYSKLTDNEAKNSFRSSRSHIHIGTKVQIKVYII